MSAQAFDDSRPTAAHCASPYLNVTMSWVHRQVMHHRRYRPIVLTQEARNPDLFPVEPLYDAAAWPPATRWFHRIALKVTGQYASYAPILRRERAALIHAHFGQEGYRLLDARGRTGLPMITTFYGLDVSALPRLRAWRRRFERLFDQGDLFLAEGPFLGRRLEEIGCPARKVRVQKLGVDLSVIPFRPDREIPGGNRIVLMCGYFNEKKGFSYGVRAFGRIAPKYPDLRLHIIGDGPMREEIEAAVRDAGVGARVSFLGLLPPKEYLKHLLAAQVLLHPSVTAPDGDTEGGAPVVLIEALASGLPVVSTLHADIPEVAPDGHCGLLAAERDVGGLAERLEVLLGDRSVGLRMGTAGRQHVEAHHDALKLGERLETIYDEVVGAALAPAHGDPSPAGGEDGRSESG